MQMTRFNSTTNHHYTTLNKQHLILTQTLNMKKSILVLVFISFAFAGYSQVEVRPFLGANFSNVSETQNGVSTKAKLGGQIGVGLQFGNRFYFNPQIAYFSRSTEFSYKDNLNINTEQKVSGVSIPLLLGLRVIDLASDPLVNVRIFGGPSLLFLTHKEFTNEGIDETVDWNTTQWGAQLGAGLDVSIFFVDASYEWGLSKTNKYEAGSNFKDVKNNTFYINAGVRLLFAS